MKLDSTDKWVQRGYDATPIEPGVRPAVLVIDLQHLHTDPESPLAGAPLIERAIGNTERVLHAARAAAVPVYHTTVAWSDPLTLGLWGLKIEMLPDCTPDSHWAQVDRRLWDDSDVHVPKLRPSMFHGTPLHALLTYTQRDTLIVTGATTSGCVRATVVDAMSCNFRTLVPEDCVGDHDDPPHRANLLDMQRKYAEVVTCDDVLAYFETVQEGVAA
jgi:maleamate amidohydrolase